MQSSLDVVVTGVATRLMGVDAATSAEVSRHVMADLVAHFDVDVGFLRHHDHRIHASRLIAKWPPRTDAGGQEPLEDPLELIYFADADPVFAFAEHLTNRRCFAPRRDTTNAPPKTADTCRPPRWRAPRCWPVTSPPACSVSSSSAIREWSVAELNALMAIASLFAQVQARVEAEDQLRYLAEHDDLTGLRNRRALLADVDARLAPGQPSPVAALFIDLDRLKAINDYLGHTAGDRFLQALADRLEAATGGRDMIARLGGDEFVVIPALPMSAEQAEALAHQLQSILRERVAIDGELLDPHREHRGGLGRAG